MSDTQSNIVIDNGSSTIKCGFSGENAPKSIISNTITKDGIVGDDTLPDIIYPVEHGIIKNFEEMEKIWKHTFNNELKVNSDERNVLISDSPLAPKINREKITQILFEKFNVQGLFICSQQMLSLYSVGSTTAIIVDSGDDSTHIVPIIEGYSHSFTITKMNYGGRAITNFLIKKLSLNGLNFTKKIGQEVKEKFCRVSLDFENEERNENICKDYILPDDTKFSAGKELFECPETIFKPELMDLEFPGIHYQIYNSIMKCDNEIRKDLYSNIILSGGNTLFSKFPERLTEEMKKLSPNSLISKVNINAQSERKYSSWIGGSTLAGLSNFQAMWISHSEYQDAGPQVIHRKCL